MVTILVSLTDNHKGGVDFRLAEERDNATQQEEFHKKWWDAIITSAAYAMRKNNMEPVLRLVDYGREQGIIEWTDRPPLEKIFNIDSKESL
jgi:hypothetical protein